MDFLFPEINTAIAGVLALVLVVYYMTWRAKGVKRSVAPPEAGGAWPIIGHLHKLGGRSRSQLPHINLASMADKYGPVFTIRLGVHPALVVSGWEVARELFTVHDVAVSSRPKYLAFDYLSYNYAMFGFTPYGPQWRELRKITSVELLSNRRLELLEHVRISETETSIKELYELWKEKKNDSVHVLVEMKQWFKDLTFNTILRMVAGKRYFGTSTTRDKKEAKRCQEVMREFFRLTGVFVLADYVPLLRWLDLGGYEKAMKETAKQMDDIMEGWLEEHRKKKNSGKTTSEEDFMDVMMSVAAEGGDFGDFDPDTITKATCMVLIASGSDTTVVMLTWFLSLLLNNRGVLKKAQEELDLHVGKERMVKESDISNLVYLQAIVKETLRLHPAGPFSGPRIFSEDCNVGGYHVPKGTRLLVNLWKIQRDPKVWSDPSEFRPERFLTDHKDIDVKGQHFQLIPFGAGRRLCPGISFGLQMLHLVLANLLHGFELSTPADAPVDMAEIPGLTNAKATPLEVLVVPRLAHDLY